MASPTIPRLFPDATVVCMATGPSLTEADVELVRGKAPVIAVSNAVFLAPFSDVLWSSDANWYRWHKGVPSFTGLKYCLEAGAEKWGAHVLKYTGKDGLELSPHAVKTGKNSGYAAINCAVHLGAKRIVLLGYDMQRGPKGEEHFFGHHPNNSRSNFIDFIKVYQTLVQPLSDLGVEVINCTRRTALKVFPRQPLEAVFVSNEVAA